MRSFFLIATFLLSTFAQSFALPVIIKGKSAAGDAFVFRLYVQEDPISGLEVLVDQSRPDQAGNFMLGFEAREIQKVTIKVGLQSISLFVQAGKTYDLNFNEITLDDQNVFLPQSPLRVVFENEDMLNLVIDGFDYVYQDFIQNQFIDLIKYRDNNIYRLFEKSVYKKLKETPLEDSVQYAFFKNYIAYRLADIRLSARLDERDSLGIEMIDKQNIELNNPAYSQFFMKYFDQYLFEYDKGELFSMVQKALSLGSSSAVILDKMGQDIVLRREQIRELVFIYALKQIYFKRQIKKESVNQILDHLSKNSKFELNRGVAANVYQSLISFQSGYPIPAFSLTNLHGQLKNNDSYKGKYTYLMFVSPDCETCETDIRLLKALKDEYNDWMQLVTIYAGFNKEQANQWAKKQNADWDFLWFNDDFALLNDYKVKNFPKYLLLDKDATLLHYFPPTPREDFMGMLKALEKRDHEVKHEASDFFRKN